MATLPGKVMEFQKMPKSHGKVMEFQKMILSHGKVMEFQGKVMENGLAGPGICEMVLHEREKHKT